MERTIGIGITIQDSIIIMTFSIRGGGGGNVTFQGTPTTFQGAICTWQGS